MPIRKNPAMVAILSGKRHYSYKFMQETGEFGINIPDATIAKQVIQCGKVSGYEMKDKFSEFGFTSFTRGYSYFAISGQYPISKFNHFNYFNQFNSSSLRFAEHANSTNH